MSSFRMAHGRRFAASLATFGVLLLALAWPPSASAKGVEESIVEGDRHYSGGQLTEARASYLSAVQASPGSFLALCRLSRSESELGELQKGDEQRRTWSAAVEHARAAVKAAPDSGSGHVWLAVALGRQAMREGAKTKLALSREIKSETDRSLELEDEAIVGDGFGHGQGSGVGAGSERYAASAPTSTAPGPEAHATAGSGRYQASWRRA